MKETRPGVWDKRAANRNIIKRNLDEANVGGNIMKERDKQGQRDAEVPTLTLKAPSHNPKLKLHLCPHRNLNANKP